MASEDRVAQAGLSEADFSPFSYRSPDGTIAAEEHCDAHVFITAWTGRKWFRTPIAADVPKIAKPVVFSSHTFTHGRAHVSMIRTFDGKGF